MKRQFIECSATPSDYLVATSLESGMIELVFRVASGILIRHVDPRVFYRTLNRIPQEPRPGDRFSFAGTTVKLVYYGYSPTTGMSNYWYLQVDPEDDEPEPVGIIFFPDLSVLTALLPSEVAP